MRCHRLEVYLEIVDSPVTVELQPIAELVEQRRWYQSRFSLTSDGHHEVDGESVLVGCMWTEGATAWPSCLPDHKGNGGQFLADGLERFENCRSHPVVNGCPSEQRTEPGVTRKIRSGGWQAFAVFERALVCRAKASAWLARFEASKQVIADLENEKTRSKRGEKDDAGAFHGDRILGG